MDFAELYRKHKLALLMGLAWTVLLGGSLAWNIHTHNEHSLDLAYKQARDIWNKDLAFREWATRHGGIYVVSDERTPPNPYLEHLPNRDILTSDGTLLTLMNPAYMMKQMVTEYEDSYGVRGRITGKVLLNPENKADPWEFDAITLFEQGESEISEIADIEGQPYLRFMRPMIMSEGCIKCHGFLGFKEGDIRGGVSVSVPLEPYIEEMATATLADSISHATVWLLGLIALVFFTYLNNQRWERLRDTEAVLARTQKMNALNKLTGGIAHDFNNILNVVIGFSELLDEKLKTDPELSGYTREIIRASNRGSRLTHKLLAISRHKTTEPRNIDLNAMIREEQQVLEKLLTAKITLTLDLKARHAQVWLDSAELEDAILNLCINAMHAMKNGGELEISTYNRSFDATTAEHRGIATGDYVLMTISDNGSGMDSQTQDQIFDPFFTTKGQRGSGLGLSQVYGFVQRAGGMITVESAPGDGSRFHLFFPCSAEALHDKLPKHQRKDEAADDKSVLRGSETILVVDDEPALLELGKQLLEDNGYTVLSAANAEEALEVLKDNDVDLVFSDVIMPGMDGYKLASIIQTEYPAIKIQLTSGFDDKRDITTSDVPLQNQLLRKPYKAIDLLRRIREQLGAGKSPDRLSATVTPVPEQFNDTCIDILDSEHHSFDLLIERCRQAAAEQDTESLEHLISLLTDYTRIHFIREECVMQACGYPWFEKHKRVHDFILAQMDDRTQQYLAGEITLPTLIKQISDWTDDHVNHMDDGILPYCEGKEDIIKAALDAEDIPQLPTDTDIK